MKRMFVSVAMSGVIAGLGFLYLQRLGEVESKEQTPNEKPVPSVAVQMVSAQDLVDTRILTGRISAWEEVTLSAETSGKIESQSVDEGSRVEAGQEIIQINTTKARARHAQAKAEFRLTEQELRRIQGLQEEGISSPRELDQARARREAARASLRLAEIELDQSVIKSGFDGVVDHLFQEEGEYVSVGMPLAKLVQIDRVKFMTGIPERDLPFFSEGGPVRIYIDAYPDRTFSGRIHRIATSASPATLTFTTEIEMDNADGALHPGMVAKAILIRQTHRDAISVPLFSVVRGNGERYVFVEKDGIAEKRTVQTGFFESKFIHILDGLKAGDRLIVVGHRQLHDGARVNVREVLDQPVVRPVDPFAAQ